MPKLFEAFVAQWLKLHLPNAFALDTQYHIKLRATADLSFTIDLSGKPLAVLDTKYKASLLPTEADIQQVVAYAVEVGVDTAYLIYPSPIAGPNEVRIGNNIRIRSAVFDISQDPDEAGKQFLRNVLHDLAATRYCRSAVGDSL